MGGLNVVTECGDGVTDPAILSLFRDNMVRAALIPDFTDTSITKYCCYMYSQVQVPIPMHKKY